MSTTYIITFYAIIGALIFASFAVGYHFGVNKNKRKCFTNHD